MRVTQRILLVATLTSASGQLAALSSDSDQPIELEADSVEIDDEKGTSVYSGNVRLVQGSIRIQGDTLTITEVGEDENTAVMIGTPVRFRQQPDGDEEEIRGQSLRAEYFTETGVLMLYDEAVIHQGKENFSSDRIRYNSNDSTVHAGQAASGTQRVRSTIMPKKKKTATE